MMTPENVPPPEVTDVAPEVLSIMLAQYVAENPDIFLQNPQLQGDLAYIVSYSPESRLQLLEHSDVPKHELTGRSAKLSLVCSRLHEALETNLITKPLLQQEVRNRLLRLEIYLAAHTPSDTE